MNGWFTIEEIDTQTFAISEYQHYEETHCYLLCGQNKAALIDTGLGVSNIKCVVNHLNLYYWIESCKPLEHSDLQGLFL